MLQYVRTVDGIKGVVPEGQGPLLDVDLVKVHMRRNAAGDVLDVDG
jgi:hypothetical protein